MGVKMNRNILCNFILSNLIEEGGSRGKRARKKIFKKALILNYVKKKRAILKSKRYFDIIERYPDDIFREHFRMSRFTFQKLLKLLLPFWIRPWTGRPAIGLRQALYITIWKLANNSTYRDISDRFNISKSTAYKLVIKVTGIVFKIRRQFIKWPSTEEINQVMDEFQKLRKHPFPFVIGCVDGTHINIPPPLDNKDSYYNRKGTHSLLLQAVCDSKCVFRDVFFGMPGRMHDAAVWSSSPLGKAFVARALPIPNQAFLLGDSAYPLTSYLMVPYRDNGYLDETQSRFNTILSKTKVCIEQAFGMLKNKFRILKYLDMQVMEHAKYIVLTCICLHNFIIMNEGFKEAVEEVGFDNAINMESTIQENENSNEAKRIRDNLANLFAA